MNNSGDESTWEYFPETTDAGGDSDADDIETDGETVTTVPGNVKPLYTNGIPRRSMPS